MYTIIKSAGVINGKQDVYSLGDPAIQAEIDKVGTKIIASFDNKEEAVKAFKKYDTEIVETDNRVSFAFYELFQDDNPLNYTGDKTIMTIEKKQQITIMLSAENLKRLEKLKRDKGISRASVIAMLIADYYTRQEDRYEQRP